MLAVMGSTLVIMLLTVPLKGVVFSGIFMALVAVWAWRYPSNKEEWQRRKDNGEKIGWLR